MQVNCICFSQMLKPSDVIFKGGDTLFCFNISQSRILAKKIIAAEYCDSISLIQSQEIALKDSVNVLHGRIANNLYIEKNNLEKAIGLKDIIISTRERELKREKIFKWVGFGIAALVLVLK